MTSDINSKHYDYILVGGGSAACAAASRRLKVRGCEGLRVIDASMMPNIISGNTSAVVLAVADKAADIILGSRS
jgi:choline dehydrogenase